MWYPGLRSDWGARRAGFYMPNPELSTLTRTSSTLKDPKLQNPEPVPKGGQVTKNHIQILPKIRTSTLNPKTLNSHDYYPTPKSQKHYPAL